MKHLISVLPILILAACSGHSGSSHSHSHDDSSHKHGAEIVTETHDSFTSLSALFDEKAFVVPISEVDCTLSGGTATRCLSITLKPEPAYFQIGPWCPRHIDDGPDVSGVLRGSCTAGCRPAISKHTVWNAKSLIWKRALARLMSFQYGLFP